MRYLSTLNICILIHSAASFLTPPSCGLDNVRGIRRGLTLTTSGIQSHRQETPKIFHVSQQLPRVRNANKSNSSTSLNAVANPASVLWVASTVLGGALGTPFVMKATRTWYNTIPLPSYTPPNAIFGPVWSFLYTSMGIASWRIRKILTSSTTTAATPYLSFIHQYIMLLSLVHYALNIIWAPVFFGMKRFRSGHVLNVAIWASLIPLIVGYFSIDLVSGMLLIPYFLWLSFAVGLSNGICKLNPTNTKEGRLFNNAKLESEIWKLRAEAGKNVGL